jgi:hypothetical protein
MAKTSGILTMALMAILSLTEKLQVMITKAKQTIIGNANPKLYGGINSDIDYKNFSLGLNFAYKIGGKLYDATSKMLPMTAIIGTNSCRLFYRK